MDFPLLHINIKFNHLKKEKINDIGNRLEKLRRYCKEKELKSVFNVEFLK